MRTSQTALAIFAAASLHQSTAQRKRSSLRESRRRELDEFGNALSLSMSIPEEDFAFGDDASISLSMSTDAVAPLGPAGFKWELPPVIVVSADEEKKTDKKEKGDKPDKKEKDDKPDKKEKGDEDTNEIVESDKKAEKKEKDDKPEKKEKDDKPDKKGKDDKKKLVDEAAPKDKLVENPEPKGEARKSAKARKW
ncbi:hypothetical protein ACHAWO_011743 [Cyclotella atomus]|uniref:Uncharacterized protein n=1 Tax=Cyclotella atomus TaxID=382360 RepID=A0ABD3MP36_9STRA